VFTQAPDWTVTIRNSAHHAYLKMPYQKWIVTGMMGAANLGTPSLSWRSIQSGTLTYKGLPVTRFKFPRVYKNGTTAPLSAGDEGFALAYQGKEVTQQEARVLDALFNRWYVPGIQLKSFATRGSVFMPYRCTNSEVATPTTVETISWQRSKNKPLLDLKGYKLVKKPEQVWEGLTSMEGGMLDILVSP
jgi:hypothetical protein